MELIKTRQIDDLALLLIESQLVHNLDFKNLKHDFVTKKPLVDDNIRV